ncbi:MAG: RHS repeat domain-containing protein [Nitrospiraceae bacterium]
MVAIGNHGRPTQVTSGTLLTTHFKHNGRGERVWVDNVGGTQLANFPDKTLHFDESGKVLAEHWPGGVMYEYLYVDEVPVTFVKYNGTNGGGTGTVYYYHSDHLNTPRYATDAAGTLVWASGFPGEDPFRPGSMSAYGLNLEPRLRFPGQYYQAETGAVYNYFRDYDPVAGRYLQSDPIGLAGGVNTYVYAENGPLKFADPQGLVAAAPSRGAGSSIADLLKPPSRRPTRDQRTGSNQCLKSPSGGSGEVCFLAPSGDQGNSCTYFCPISGEQIVIFKWDIGASKSSRCPPVYTRD